MHLSPGTRLGPYEILTTAGKGGMGEVYRARDTRLDRTVAIKILSPELASSAELKQRFEREAKAVAALSHPNILSLHDFGDENGVAFAVTEFLEGETLRSRLVGGAFPLRKAVETGASIAEGLAAAHSKGVIHRDLKPENIFLTTSGQVKILDFGLARVDRVVTADDQTVDLLSAATDPGVVMGTAGYMSPEQVRGQKADARSDIFSFGCVLYELVTGLRAFARESSAESMTAILKEDPPELPESGKQVPPEVDRLIRHCLEKNPEQRFQSARDLVFALRNTIGASGASQVAAAALPGRGLRPFVKFGVAGLILASILFSVGWFTAQGLSPRRSYWKLPVGAPRRALTLSGDIRHSAISPDGKQIAFVLNKELYVQGLSGGEPRKLTDDGFEKVVPRFSPDGTQLLFGRARGMDRSGARIEALGYDLYAADAAAGGPRLLVEDARAGLWSPDGKRLAFVRASSEEAFVADADGKNPISLGQAHTYNFVPGLAWSPDGKQLAIISQAKVFLVSADGQSRREVPGAKAMDVIFTPGGNFLILNWASPPYWALWQIPVSGGQMTPFSMVPFDSVGPTLSADGDKLLVSMQTGSSQIAVRAVGKQQSERITFGDDEWFPALSPDGRKLTFVRDGVWIADADGSHPHPLGSLPHSQEVAWAPDGRSVTYTMRVFETGKPAHTEVCVTRLDEGICREVNLSPMSEKSVPSFTSDGKNIIFGFKKDQTAAFGLWMAPVSGGEGRQLVNDGMQAMASPVGTLVAYFGRGHNTNIRLVDYATGKDAELVPASALEPYGGMAGPIPPRWSSDGGYIFLAAKKAVLRVNVTSGVVERFADPLEVGGWGFAFSVTPDQKRIIYSRQSAFTQPWVYALDSQP